MDVPNPNILVNPDASQFLGAAVSLIPFSLLAVGLRFWTRWYHNYTYRIEDWLTIPALAGNIALSGLAIWAHTTHSLGYVTPAPPKGVLPEQFVNEQIQVGKKLSWSIEIIQCVTLTCTKLSCLYFYRRIFCTGMKSAFNWISLGLICFSVFWGVTYFFCFIFVCRGASPANLWHNIQSLNQHCGHWPYFTMTFGITDVIVDFAIFILPFIMVYRLKMSTTRKLAVASMFFVGAFAIAAVIMRSYVITKASLTAIDLYSGPVPAPSNKPVTSQVLWGCIESAATLTATCLPALYAPGRDFIRRYKRRTDSKRSGSYAFSSKNSRRWSNLPKTDDSGTDEIPMFERNIVTTAQKNSFSGDAHSQDTIAAPPPSQLGPHIRIDHSVEQVVHYV